MEILQPYNNNTLQLISSDDSISFEPGFLLGQNPPGVIKLSVFSDTGFYLDDEDLQNNIDFYVKNEELFIKPNEYLDRNGFAEGNYNLQYDFLIRSNTDNLCDW
mgnify:FL=1